MAPRDHRVTVTPRARGAPSASKILASDPVEAEVRNEPERLSKRNEGERLAGVPVDDRTGTGAELSAA